MARYTRAVFITLLLFILVTYSSFRFGDVEPRIPHFYTQQPKQDPALEFKAHTGGLKDVQNATLGFQKIFVVNLPERPDKLDAFSLAASLTGFRTEVLPGVKGETVMNKTLPTLNGLPEKKKERNNVIGCWRAHMNFARRVLNENLRTALVMEDDADWDINLKNQMVLLAQGTQYITGVPSGTRPMSPYGDDWDLLWIGHCSSTIQSGDQRRFIIENDNTVAIPEHRVNFLENAINTTKEGLDPRTRLVYQAGEGLCTYSYALSNRGAQKMLMHQSLMKKWVPIDLGLGVMCKEEKNFKCLGVFPQLVDSHKGAGETNKDSDILDPSAKSEVREKGYTFNIVHSTRLNMDKLIRGEKPVDSEDWSQFPDQPPVEGPARTRTMNRQKR
ncbi:uncharacterized protein KY384_005715 [Bacidia gigantensis]|uniref:uncharacterized protein n=1 Tax=Bacidia gigantensis TaxID=2732470 RepID=UPI001D03A333|nr:uncharacterized protein KY384_005715 [Bacidia gigantensis]KAG8529080.1 hypothetical protein KY384_005715 [Bacidia gigantensis]